MKTKTKNEILIMTEGGKMLAGVKEELRRVVDVGVSGMEVEDIARRLIKKTGGKPSFMSVPNYHWATCINVNDEVVHGIPKKDKIFKKGDVVSVDVGLLYKKFHTDTSITVYLGDDAKVKNFLKIGESALSSAISMARKGNYISDISEEMEKVEEHGFKVMRNLVGHGIGRSLHEDPQIPCYAIEGYDAELPVNLTIAIEIMYTMGEPETILDDDEWTIRTHDGKISALFEETVVTTENSPIILTRLGN